VRKTSLSEKLSGAKGIEKLKSAIMNLPDSLTRKEQLDGLV
jgi:hypothetical protein